MLLVDETRYMSSPPSAFDAYVDAQGVPQFQHSCVLFWDIVGVRNFSRSPKALSHLVALSAALNQARARAGFEDDASGAHAIHAVTWFTDCVSVGTPVIGSVGIEQALGYTAIGASYLQLLMLDAGFLGRGGMAFGPHYMQEQLVFGPALIDAVDLEKETRWPRVALTPEAAERNREVVRTFYSDPEDSPHADQYLVDEEDNAVFVDPLGGWLAEEDDENVANQLLSRQRGVVEAALARETGEVFRKWKWLADMHNHVLNRTTAFHASRIGAGAPQHSFRSFISTL